MTFLNMLTAAENLNQSMLCVGLDPEPTKFPGKFKGDANKIYDFCAAIVDATADLVSAFKPQIAYFAAHRAEEQLERAIAGETDPKLLEAYDNTRALIRRGELAREREEGPAEPVIVRGQMTLDPARHQCTWKNEPVTLTVTVSGVSLRSMVSVPPSGMACSSASVMFCEVLVM